MTDALAAGIKGYTAWRKALWADDHLRTHFAKDKNRKWDLRVTAEAVALHGANGRSCFASSGRIAAKLGCTRELVERHRITLTELGWLAVVGRKGRAAVYDIALPDAAETVPEPSDDAPPALCDAWILPADGALPALDGEPPY